MSNYIPPGPLWKQRCGAICPVGQKYSCDREAGHPIPHVSHAIKMMIALWDELAGTVTLKEGDDWVMFRREGDQWARFVRQGNEWVRA